jgi:hypothetical protein
MTTSHNISSRVDSIIDALNQLTDPVSTALLEQPVMTFALDDGTGRIATVWWSGNDGEWKHSVAPLLHTEPDMDRCG